MEVWRHKEGFFLPPLFILLLIGKAGGLQQGCGGVQCTGCGAAFPLSHGWFSKQDLCLRRICVYDGGRNRAYSAPGVVRHSHCPVRRPVVFERGSVATKDAGGGCRNPGMALNATCGVTLY